MIEAHFTTKKVWKPKKDEGKDTLKTAGVKKVRMGEFMDTGKCKG